MGPERAENMVAMHELTSRGVPLSLHSDFAMAPAEPLTLAWVAINRIVASGKVMRPDQRISVFDAMKGITITAARTLELEEQIGSIKEGKEATFTILQQNPFKIDPVAIKDIPIIGVVYKGKFKMNTAHSEAKLDTQLLGGWSEAEINADVEAALDTVLQQMNTSAKLEKILSVKTQVVAGLN